jgi:putative signal transducing protein
VVGVRREPRPGGRIVELVNLPTRFEADAVIGMLQHNGIKATGKYGDAEGWMPHMALLDGYRVFVFDDDLDAARELLEAEEISGA